MCYILIIIIGAGVTQVNVFDFSNTLDPVTLYVAHCIRFFAYIWPVHPPRGTLYSIFRIHLARSPSTQHIVFDFSNTFGPSAPSAAHCIRFFAYIWPVHPPRGTLYSIFRIHLARSPSTQHNVFDFSHTLDPVTLYAAHCIRFFAYIWPVHPPRSTLYSIFRIHWARLPPARHIVFDFSNTLGPSAPCAAQCIRFFEYIGPVCPLRSTLYSIFRIHLARSPSTQHIVFDFSNTLGPSAPCAAHCIRFFEYIGPVHPPRSTLYSIFRIHWARSPSTQHIVFDFSNTFGPSAPCAAHCIRFFAYIGPVCPLRGTMYSIFRIHWTHLPPARHIVFDFSHTLDPVTLYTAHCIRFLEYIGPVCPLRGTLYSIFRIYLARSPSTRHIVFDFSNTLDPVTLCAAHCIRFFEYIGPVCPLRGTLYSIFRIHWTRLPPARHIVFDFSNTLDPVTLCAAHCIRFSAYIGPGQSPASNMYSFRITLKPNPDFGAHLCIHSN